MPGSNGRVRNPEGLPEPELAPGEGRRDVTWDVLSEHISDLIIITDLAGVIFYVSPAARKMGYEPHELVGLKGADLIHPEELDRCLADRACVHAEGGAHGQDRQHRFRRRDGSWAWLEGNPKILPGPNGQPMGVLNVFRDVSEQEELKVRLRDALVAAEQAAPCSASWSAPG